MSTRGQNRFRHEGLSQQDRFKDELQPDFVQIDGRSMNDMLEFIRRYAEHINFIDDERLEKGNHDFPKWDNFFIHDNLILLIAMSNYDMEKTKEDAQLYIDRASTPGNKNLASRGINAYTELILDMASRLQYFSVRLQKSVHTSDLVFDIRSAITGELNDHLIQLYYAKKKSAWKDNIKEMFAQTLKDWNRDQSLESLKKQVRKSQSNLDEAQLRAIFNSFQYTLYHIVEKSKALLEDMLLYMKNSKPHIALYVAFLKIYEYAKEIQNKIPQKHLDYYYRDLLKQTELDAKPDHVLVNIKLANGEKHHQLPEGTILYAKENALGEPIYFKTDQFFNLVSSRIMKICTMLKSTDPRYHQQPNPRFVTDIYCSEYDRPEKGDFIVGNIALFGEEQILKTPRGRTMQPGRTGFVIASPILLLGSGKRQVRLELCFENAGFDECYSLLQDLSKSNQESLEETIYKAFSTGFQIGISQEDTIKEFNNYAFKLDEEKKSWVFHFQLSETEAAIKPVSEKKERYPECEHPFIEVLLKHECSLFMYSIISALMLKNIKIKTTTENLKSPQLYNTYGPVNTDTPFELFGVIPKKDSFFVLGHPEVFSKNIDKLYLDMQWFSLPIAKGGVESYFKEYTNQDFESAIPEKISTADFKIKKELLRDNKWFAHPLDKGQPIFRNKQEQGVRVADEYSQDLSIHIDMKNLGYEPLTIGDEYAFSQSSTHGFLRFRLDCPEWAFGHEHYAILLSETVAQNGIPKRKGPPLKQPKPPFSPLVSKVQLDYEASAEAVPDKPGARSKDIIQFYQLRPFGFEEKVLKTSEQGVRFMDDLPNEGSLMLGLDSYPHHGEISLLFILNEEAESSHSRQELSPVHWWYLSDNEWHPFEDNDILNDTTHMFVNAGLVQLKIPAKIDRNSTLMDNRYFWIKATVAEGSLTHGRLVSIHENGVQATWDQSCEPLHIENKIQAHTIKSTKESIPQIAEVNQPIASFYGRKKEDPSEFYNRVSERLHHKQRAVNINDYEQILLQQFPAIFKTKCFSAEHTLDPDYKDNSLFLPGSLKIVAVPYFHSSVNRNYPRVSMRKLQEITAYLKQYTSPFVRLEVANAHYQKVRVICKVSFTNQDATSYYENKIQVDIKQYLNPWLINDETDLEFGRSIYKSEVLTFLEGLEYVSFITEFSLVNLKSQNSHFEMFDTARDTNIGANNNEIKADWPWSLLVSAQHHDITVVNTEEHQLPHARAVSNMEVGTDLIVSNN